MNPDQEFATNRPDATPPERVADAVLDVLREAREQLAELPRISISTAYFNPGGFNLLAPELEQTGPVRLLLGAEPEAYVQRKDGSLEVRQQIVVARDSQKSIVLGKQGSRIKAIGEAARKELGELLGQKVHLFLHVRVEENWDEKSRDIYEEMGLDWQK